jgi:hypothetical protein
VGGHRHTRDTEGLAVVDRVIDGEGPECVPGAVKWRADQSMVAAAEKVAADGVEMGTQPMGGLPVVRGLGVIPV